MDYRERFAKDEEALRLAMRGNRAGLWTAMPGIFQSFNTDKPGTITAVVQPAIQGVVQAKDGTFSAVNMPLLLDVPVVFPHGGGCSLTFPIKVGDECLVVFSSRCIDAWWQNGGVQLPMEPRMHDLSDGFAIPGPYSVPNAPANISTTSVQLRSDDGVTVIDLNPTAHTISLTTTGSVTVNSEYTQVNGNLSVSENVSVGNGATGTFVSKDGKVISVIDGIITNII